MSDSIERFIFARISKQFKIKLKGLYDIYETKGEVAKC